MHVRVDGTWERIGTSARILLAGSPLRIFRLTAAGAAICDRIETGDDVADSTLVRRLLDAGAIHPAPCATETPTFTACDVTIVTPQLGGTLLTGRDVTVDDGSDPPIPGATVRLASNRGPGAARNAGRQEVDSALIAFVDADVTLTDDCWLEVCVRHFDDPAVGLVAPRVLGDPTASLDLGAEPARIRAGSRVSYVPAAAIVVRVAAFDAVGGFDETLRFGEDVDFVWRLDQAGWRCRYEPAVSVGHRPRSSWAARMRQQIGYGSAAAPLAMRHPRALAPFRSNGWMAATWIGLALGHPFVAASLALTNGVVLVRRIPDIPPARIVRLVLAAHVAGGRQLATTLRRVWWPIVVVTAIFSKRARRLAVAAIAADVRRTPVDLAYGWGLWQGMIRHRTWRPVVPEISAWPPARRRPTRGHERRLDADGH